MGEGEYSRMSVLHWWDSMGNGLKEINFILFKKRLKEIIVLNSDEIPNLLEESDFLTEFLP